MESQNWGWTKSPYKKFTKVMVPGISQVWLIISILDEGEAARHCPWRQGLKGILLTSSHLANHLCPAVQMVKALALTAWCLFAAQCSLWHSGTLCDRAPGSCCELGGQSNAGSDLWGHLPLVSVKIEQMTTFVALDLSSPGSTCEGLTSLFASRAWVPLFISGAGNRCVPSKDTFKIKIIMQ